MPAAASGERVREEGPRPAIRSVLLFVNPRSGRGRAARIGGALAAALKAAGVVVQRVDLGTPEAAQLASAGADGKQTGAAVVVGGDGTVHSCAGMLARAGIPVYHVPTGTENLFARQFGMKANAAAVLGALQRGRTTTVDVGECRPLESEERGTARDAHRNGEAPEAAGAPAGGLQSPRAFLVMGSVGVDAGVIHRLAAARRGAISHWSYVGPIARELMQHRAPRFSIDVDGRCIVDGVRGVAIVANSRQYAMRIDPANRAEMNDGALDLVFFPARRLTDVSAWAVLARLRLHHRRRGLITARGREFIVRAREGRAVLQLDGEAVGGPDATEGSWRFSIRESALRVLA